jgi:hypothetical protein
MIDPKVKERLEPILAEFRKGIAHHRAEGATEERIKQILGASSGSLSSKSTIPTFALGFVMSSVKLLTWRLSSRTTRQAGRGINRSELQPLR